MKVIALGAPLWLGAGCSATTGVDVEVEGADKLQADQIVITGDVAGSSAHMATVPDSPRALLSPEDVRIVLPDDFADQVVTVHVQLMKAGKPLGGPVENKAILVRNHTKRIHFCFGDSGCASATGG